jgi:hypothetical protein
VNDTIAEEVASYATAVRAACADLPGPDRELLLEDLEDHLAEVAAEAGGPLEERLGRPEAYAAELRASAGLPAPGAGTGRRRGRLRGSRAARGLAGLGSAVAGHPAARAVAGFLPELRPAWWVLRGYLAVQAVAVAMTPLISGGGFSFPVPRLFGSALLGLLATVVAVAGSVWLGRRRGARVRAAQRRRGDHQHLPLRRPGPAAGGRLPGRPGRRPDRGRPLRQRVPGADGPLDGNGDEVPNRYPQVQHEVDAAGQRQPGPTPEFRPPPGPVRAP